MRPPFVVARQLAVLVLAGVLVAGVGGCRREIGASPGGVDALWSLAPAGARGAIVMSPRSVAMAEDAIAAVRTMFDAVPELAPAKAQLDAMFAELGGPAVTLADLGMTRTRGAALFLVPDGMVAILPVADRDRFLAHVRGTKGATAAEPDRLGAASCKLVRGLYACATAEPLLATLGQGDLRRHMAAAGARGDIEIAATDLPFGGPQPGVAALALQLSRGTVVVRGAITHAPRALTERFTRTGTTPADPLRSSGFALIDLASFVHASPAPVVADVTVEKVLRSLDGFLAVVVPAGALTFDIELPLREPAPFRTIVERCAELPGAAVLNARAADGACRVVVPEMALELDAWVEETRLRIGRRDQPVTGQEIPMTPFGRELARGAWSFAFWGRGTMLGTGAPPAQGGPELTPQAAVMIRLLALVNEIGLAARVDGERAHLAGIVRTALSNPDDLVAKLNTIPAVDITSSRAAVAAKAIADAAPGSPFAADFAAGQGGLIIPTALVGAGISTVLPMLLAFRAGATAEPPPVDPGDPGDPGDAPGL